jgi:hypothetical protein
MAVTVLMDAVATMARETVRRGLFASSTRCMVESRPAQMAQPGPTRPVMKHMASLQPVLLSSLVQTAAESCLVGDRIRHTIGIMKQPAREPTTVLTLVLGYSSRGRCRHGRRGKEDDSREASYTLGTRLTKKMFAIIETKLKAW